MPRRLFHKFRPIAKAMQQRWYFRMLGPRLTDPRLWAVNRRAITAAFGVGVAISFVPLPIHLVLGLAAAMIWRLNVPAMVGTLLLLNPFTAVPVYYLAYRVGAFLLGVPPGAFAFDLSFDWLQNGLGALWKPFLLGCVICGLIFGFLAYHGLELAWRLSALRRVKARRGNISP
jgi:uncharacterized protein